MAIRALPVYDHPSYTVVREMSVGTVTGASGSAGTKFSAFTAKLVKSVTLRPTTAGTSNDVPNFLSITGTTTTTTAIGTFGSGATAFQNAPLNIALNQGDLYWVQKGTDATVVYVGELEVVTQPLAPVTV